MEHPPTKPDAMPSSGRLLAIATALTGSHEAVRAAIGASPTDFEALQAGRQALTGAQFDQLVALIFREHSKLIEQNRALMARLKTAPWREPDAENSAS